LQKSTAKVHSETILCHRTFQTVREQF